MVMIRVKFRIGDGGRVTFEARDGVMNKVRARVRVTVRVRDRG